MDFGRAIKEEIKRRLGRRKIEIKAVDKKLGYQIRCAPRVPFDCECTRDLGHSAIRFLAGGGSGAMVSIQDGKMVPMGLPDIMDINGKTRVRMVDTSTESYLVYMGCVSILCKLVRGKAGSEHTMWIGFQVTSVLFVVSSFVNLIGGMLTTIPKVASWLVSLGKLGNSVAHNSAYIFFLTLFALLNIYLPPALKTSHGFGWGRCLVVGLGLSLFWVFFGIIFTADLRVH